MNLIDTCVICSKATGYKKTDHISKRNYYVEGCGQLCKDCFERVYIKETNSNRTSAKLLND